MASEIGRGAQNVITGDARDAARGAGGTLLGNITDLQQRIAAGEIADPNSPDGSTADGTPALEPVLSPGGVGGVGGGGDNGEALAKAEEALDASAAAIASAATAVSAAQAAVAAAALTVTEEEVGPIVSALPPDIRGLTTPEAEAIIGARIGAEAQSHAEAADPHPVYWLGSRIQEYVENAVAQAMAAHLSELNPHPQYTEVAEPPPAVAPGAVTSATTTGGSPTATATSSTAISATWGPPATGTAPFTFDLRHRVGSGSWTEILGVTSPRAITGLVASTTYEVQVRAVGPGGTGGYTGTVPQFVATQAAPVVIEEPPPPAPGEYPAVPFAAIPTRVTGSSAPAGAVLTFGHTFQRGHLMPGDNLTWKDSGGTVRETQYDTAPATYWTDGSIRFTSVHVALPFVGDNEQNAGTLVKEATTAGTAINLATALAAHTIAIEIKNGSNVFTWTLAGALSAGLPAERWHQGNLKAQTRIKAAIPRAATGGGTDCVLYVDIAADKAGIVTLVPSVRNVAVFKGAKGSQGDARYDLKVTANGVVQGTYLNADFFRTRSPLYTIFAREFRFNSSGVAQGPAGWVTPSTAYAQRTGLTYHYDQQLGAGESMLAGFATERAGSSWNQPYSNRSIKRVMGGSGGSSVLGFTTTGQAAWLVSGDKRAAQYAIDQAEASLSIPWHCWDEVGGPARTGAWINAADRPYNRVRYFDSSFTVSSSDVSDDTGWQLDDGHFGDMCTIPYALTARRVFLDGLQGQASWAIMSRNQDGERRYPSANLDDNTDAGRAARMAAIGTNGRGADPRRIVQARSYGWTLRQMVGAFVVSPQSEVPYGNYWYLALKGHFQMLTGERTTAEANMKGLHGMPLTWIYEGYNGTGAPWQFPFIVMQFVRAARLEIPNAVEFLAWSDNFWSGVFNRGDCNPADWSQYNLKIWNTKVEVFADNASEFRTPAEIQASKGSGTYGVNFANVGSGGTGVDYQQRQQATTSQIYDVLADFGKSTTNVAAAHAFWQAIPQDKTYTSAAKYRLEPMSSITRRGTTRA